MSSDILPTDVAEDSVGDTSPGTSSDAESPLPALNEPEQEEASSSTCHHHAGTAELVDADQHHRKMEQGEGEAAEVEPNEGHQTFPQGRHQEAEDQDRGNLRVPPPPSVGQQQQGTTQEPPAASSASSRATTRTSSYEKDPLNIGVPFPVVRRAPPAAMATRRATQQPTSSTAASANATAAPEIQRAQNVERKLAAAASAAAAPASHTKPGVTPMPHAATATCTTTKGNHHHGVAIAMGVAHVERSMNDNHNQDDANNDDDDLDDMEASMLAVSRQQSIPGSYAIGGPGLQDSTAADDDGDDDDDDLLPSNVYVEGGSAGGDMEQAHRRLTTSHCSTADTSYVRSGSSSHASESDFLVEATLVQDQEQQDCLVEAQEAKPFQFSVVCVGAGFCIMALIIVGLMIGISTLFHRHAGDGPRYNSGYGISYHPTSSPVAVAHLDELGASSTDSPVVSTDPTMVVQKPTLQRVRETGVLRCGLAVELNAFLVHATNLQRNQSNTNSDARTSANASVQEGEDAESLSLSNRFSWNYCGAVAAAVLGLDAQFELVRFPEHSKYEMLANHSIDFLISRSAMNMEQDAYEEAVKDGLTYATPYLYSGLSFAGVEFFVNCTENNLKTFDECSDLQICANENTFFGRDLLLSVPRDQITVGKEPIDNMKNFMMGKCNVIAAEGAIVLLPLLRAFGYNGDLKASEKLHSYDMWGLTSLDADPEWADILNAVTLALFFAEESGITKENAELMGQTFLFGDSYKDMFINAIKAQGNFRDIYDFPLPRTGRNLPNDGSSGLLATPPLGSGAVQAYRGPLSNGTLETVLQRGFLRCGVHGGNPGFAFYNANTSAWEGLDVGFCFALAGSLFNGRFGAVEFHDVGVSGFVELNEGVVDVLAGAVWTLESDMREPTTGVGFTFSQPYFYGPVNDTRFKENVCLATRQDDAQWSAFVFWAAQSLVYAEEHAIQRITSNAMPLVQAFGVELQRMFRDAVHSVGNYDELYQKTLANILPRSGRNMLNLMEENGPLRYIPPGF